MFKVKYKDTRATPQKWRNQNDVNDIYFIIALVFLLF